MGWIRRLGATLRRSHAGDTFDEEARFHVDQRVDEFIHMGMSPDEARREAHLHFGSVTSARERSRDANSVAWIGDAVQDLRYAARQLRRNPGFALAAILALAIGIGVNTALFGVVNELLLKPLPVAAPHELVLFNWLEGRQGMRRGMDGIRTKDDATGRATSTSFSYPTFRRLQEANRSLTDLFAFNALQQLNVVVDGSAEVVSGQYVSGNYFRGLGVGAARGRTLNEADDTPGAPPVATVTWQHWTRRFNRDPNVVGKTVLINKVAFTVVGVTTEGFAGTLDVTQSPDFTLPFASEPLLGGERSDLVRPAFLWVNMMGRLKPGVAPAQAVACSRAREARRGRRRLTWDVHSSWHRSPCRSSC